MPRTAPESPPDDREALRALMRTMCDEAYSLGCDIINLGDALTGVLDAKGASSHARELQSFDMLGQRAIAQARLLQGVERLLANDAVEYRSCVEALIQAVPFEAERRRLFAAFHGQKLAEPEPSGNDDLELF